MEKGGGRLRTRIIVAILAIQAMVSRVHGGAPEASSQTKSYFLPWHIIAEKAAEGARFFESTHLSADELRKKRNDPEGSPDVDLNYGCVPGETMIARLAVGPAGGSPLHKVNIEVTRWADGLWKDVGRTSASIDCDFIRVAGGFEEEGFFRCKFAWEGPEGQLSTFEAYSLVCPNWRRDIVAFCRELKEQIETSPDPRLIFSSIAVSHFDHLMEMASEASFLSGRMLKALVCAIENKRKFEAGECPDLVVGLNKMRLKRFQGARIVQFAVFVPENYDSSRKWPLYVHPDAKNFYNRNNYSQRSGLIDLWWNVPGWTEFDWKNFECILSVLRSKLNLDEDRFYLYGHCGNGIAATALALNYPDRWAECGSLLGNSHRHLAGNALNLPVIFAAGQPADSALLGYFEFAVKCFQYYGCRQFRYSRMEEVAQTRGRSVPEALREKRPGRVLFTVGSLSNPKAYWVKILGREDENLTGTIDVSAEGRTILVKTRNINAYSLDLTHAPVDSNGPIEIIENGSSLGLAEQKLFVRKPTTYADATYVKNERLHGPIWDVFTDAYVVVYGSGGPDTRFCEVSASIAKSLANGGPRFADTNFPEAMVESHNLVLVGTPETNRLLAKIIERLPVQIRDSHVLTNGIKYEAKDVGFFLIYPNPLNPERYVAVFSATSPSAMISTAKVYSHAYPHQLFSPPSGDRPYVQVGLIQPIDVGIFEVVGHSEIKWHVMEKFTTLWDWHREWDRVLAVVEEKHPKWKWSRWVAKKIKEQLKADVAVCEDPFKFADLKPDLVLAEEQSEGGSMVAGGDVKFLDIEPTGQITLRDLHNSFRNDWIIKISLDGRSLRSLLTAQLNSVNEKQVSAPIMEGVSFVKTDRDDADCALSINNIRNDARYTVALPYRLINGQRAGIVLRDYEIVGEGYLVFLLRDYLNESEGMSIDSELDGMRFSMF